MICEHSRDDGAYVLGALAPAERAAFESHLAACAPCRNAVAELAALPGLLARLDVAAAERVARAADAAERAATSPDPGEPSRLSRLLSAAAATRRRDRIRRRWHAAFAGLAAVCLTLGVGLGLVAMRQPGGGPAPDASVAMVPMVPAESASAGPVTAQIALTAVAGGTRVRVHCVYQGGHSGKPYTFRLVAYGTGGETEQVASWRAAQGDELSVEGMTRFAPDELDHLEVQRADGRRLLVYTVA